MSRCYKLISCLLLLLISTSPVVAAQCDPSGSQLAMNQCALEDYERVDKELNQVWLQLLAKEKDNPVYIKKLRVAQRAWITFRDAETEATFACEDSNPRLCWGSMYPMLYHAVLSELTEARIQRLKQYLQHGQNPAVGE